MGKITIIAIEDDQLEVLRNDRGFLGKLSDAIRTYFSQKPVKVYGCRNGSYEVGATIICTVHSFEKILIRIENGKVNVTRQR